MQLPHSDISTLSLSYRSRLCYTSLARPKDVDGRRGSLADRGQRYVQHAPLDLEWTVATALPGRSNIDTNNQPTLIYLLIANLSRFLANNFASRRSLKTNSLTPSLRHASLAHHPPFSLAVFHGSSGPQNNSQSPTGLRTRPSSRSSRNPALAPTMRKTSPAKHCKSNRLPAKRCKMPL